MEFELFCKVTSPVAVMKSFLTWRMKAFSGKPVSMIWTLLFSQLISSSGFSLFLILLFQPYKCFHRMKSASVLRREFFKWRADTDEWASPRFVFCFHVLSRRVTGARPRLRWLLVLFGGWMEDRRQQSTPQGAGRGWRMKSGLETKLWLSFKRHIRHKIDLVVRISEQFT